jgi:hypothetical protein
VSLAEPLHFHSACLVAASGESISMERSATLAGSGMRSVTAVEDVRAARAGSASPRAEEVAAECASRLC